MLTRTQMQLTCTFKVEEDQSFSEVQVEQVVEKLRENGVIFEKISRTANRVTFVSDLEDQNVPGELLQSWIQQPESPNHCVAAGNVSLRRSTMLRNLSFVVVQLL